MNFPQEDTGQCLQTFLIVTAGEGGISWVEARGAAPHPAVPRTASTAEGDAAPNVPGAEGGEASRQKDTSGK